MKEKILIVNRWYTVGYSSPAAEGIGSLEGWCDKQQAMIFIRAELKGDYRKEVLLHEICHALWHEYAFPGSDNEEDMVNWMGKALTVFISDNKAFFRKHLL